MRPKRNPEAGNLGAQGDDAGGEIDMSMIPSTDLTAMECSALTHAEATIEQGVADVSKALATIRDQRLYRAEHATFEDYCRERWGISRSLAYRQIAAAEVAEILSPIGDIPESQARELAPLRAEPERMREVYAKASQATGGHPTAEAIREARRSTPDQVAESAATSNVIGLDGKRYTRTARLADRYRKKAADVRKVTGQLRDITDNRLRYPPNAASLTDECGADVLTALANLTTVITRLDPLGLALPRHREFLTTQIHRLECVLPQIDAAVAESSGGESA